MADSAWDKALTESYTLGREGEPEFVQIKNDRSAKVQYWRRWSNGEILVGPMINDTPKYQQWIEQKRCAPLPAQKFGWEYAGGKGYMRPNNTKYQFTRMPNGSTVPSWLVPLFNAGGHRYVLGESDYSFGKPGEFLLPKWQIVELELHRFQWMRDDRPDLNDVKDIECPHKCPNTAGRPGIRLFTTEDAVNQHIAAVHKEAVGPQAIGAELTKMIMAQSEMSKGADVATIATAVAAALKAVGIGSASKAAAFLGEKKYPEGRPDETWKKNELVAFIADNDLRRPENIFQMKKEETLEYVLGELDFEGVELPVLPTEEELLAEEVSTALT